jgi:hypothetical protein
MSAGRLIFKRSEGVKRSKDRAVCRLGSCLRRRRTVSLQACWADTHEALRVMLQLPAVCDKHVVYRG